MGSLHSGFPAISLRSNRRDRKVERRALFRFGFDPDPASCPLNNALTDRKTHARSGILRISVKTFKDAEDLLLEPGLDADPVVLALRTANSCPRKVAAICYARRAVAVANRISDQILKELFHLKFGACGHAAGRRR